MNLPQILQTTSEITTVTCDAVLVAVRPSADGLDLSGPAEEVDRALGGAFHELITKGFKGRPGDVLVVGSLGRLPARRVVFTGIGDRSDPGDVRKAAAAAARALPDAEDVVSALHVGMSDDVLEASLEGAVLAGYRFEGYKRRQAPAGIQRLTFVSAEARVLERGTARVEAEIVARDLTNEPASVLTPTELARRAEQLADVAGLGIEIMGPDELAREGFGGILAVGRGSEEPPCLITVTYEPKDATGSIALVGKGITYDTGGYSIKPSSSMEMMKTDMAGAAAVLASMGALGKLDIRTKVTAYLTCAENLISGKAVKPGDVITHYGGRTTEVTNTDAEGRLVLVDGLAYACEQGADAVVDLATLTGGIHIALGDDVAGLFTNDDTLNAEFEEAALRAGEAIWRMPLVQSYARDYDSMVADMKNSGSRWGSPIKAAVFLQASIPDSIPWAHLDIAGPARADKDRAEVTKGGTGFGVRTLLRWLEGRSTP